MFFVADNNDKLLVKSHKALKGKKIDIIEHNKLLKFINCKNIININGVLNVMDKIEKYDNYNYLKEIFNDCDINNIENIKNKFMNDKFSFTEDQINCFADIFEFLKNDKKYYIINGFPGTGKTFIITKITFFLFRNKMIQNVIFATPTNKSINVLRTKFEEISIEDNTKFNINYMTIHALLGYKNDFSISGEKIFTKTKKNNLGQNNLIIIDESSMIQLNMLIDLLSINNNNIKIIFVGDEAQLNPVNEKSSAIFSKTINDIKYENENKNNFFDIDIKNELENIVNKIKEIEISSLKTIVRNSSENVNKFSNHIRSWVLDNKKPKINRYICDKVKQYKHDGKNKLCSKWFKLYLKKIKKNKGNIILSWTNKQTDEYNLKIREIIHDKKKNLLKYEPNDIIIVNDYYNSPSNKKICIYTSEQLLILETSIENITIKKINDKFPEQITQLRGCRNLSSKYKSLVNEINKIQKTYKIWKLLVKKMDNSKKFYIQTIHDDSIKLYENEKIRIILIIKQIIKILFSSNREKKERFNKEIIKPLWEQFYNTFIDPFANINFGFAITTHKAQGSTYNNVFVDSDDIFKNNNINEAKRCFYTALTRASNDIYILI